MSSAPILKRVRPEVMALAPRVTELRREFHKHPELSWKEHRTGEAIIKHLRGLGLSDVRPIAGTGATGTIKGGKNGPATLWRADIDALPIPERSGLPFASVNEGVMHACGHDAHIAIALGLAELLMARREKLAGTLRFLFQPAEEHSGGAQACVAEGILESPEISRVLGLHISADVPLGAVNVAPGPFFAAPTAFRVTINGVGGHAAAPHQSVDAIVVAAHVITALQTVVSRSAPPSEAAVLTVGKLNAGFRGNVIAESATMTGTIRTYTEPMLDLMVRRTEEIIAGVCAAFGATYEMRHNTSCPPLVNDPGVTGFVMETAGKLLGYENIHGTPTMGADDMGVYLHERPGCYFWMGARNEENGIAGRHHDPGFVIDEDALPLAMELGMQLLEGSLR